MKAGHAVKEEGHAKGQEHHAVTQRGLVIE